MNISDTPLTQTLAPVIGDAASSEGPLSDVLELVGVTHPEAFGDVGGSPGDFFQAAYQAFGYDPQFAAALGSAADASTGNVTGAVSNAGEASGNEEAAQVMSLLGDIPM